MHKSHVYFMLNVHMALGVILIVNLIIFRYLKETMDYLSVALRRVSKT